MSKDSETENLKARNRELETQLHKVRDALAQYDQAVNAPALRHGIITYAPAFSREGSKEYGVTFYDGDILHLSSLPDLEGKLKQGLSVLVDIESGTIVREAERLVNYPFTIVEEILDRDRVVIKV